MADATGNPPTQEESTGEDAPDGGSHAPTYSCGNEERNAILQALLSRSDAKRKLNHGAITHVSKQFKRSLPTIRKIWQRAQESIADGSTMTMVVDHRRSNSGRKKKDFNQQLHVLPTLQTTARKTYRAAGHRINMPPSTLWRRCKENGSNEEGPRRYTVHQKPILTEEHQQKRIDYAIAQVDTCGNYFKAGYDVVHVDEKWFNMYEPSYSCILGPGEEPPNMQARNKRYIGKCMFLTAVARPRFDPQTQVQFDGKIGIWPMVHMVPAVRTGRNRPAGTLEMKSLKVDAAVYKDYIVNEVIVAIEDKWPQFHRDRPIYIQHDNATSHGALKETDPDLIEAIHNSGLNISLLSPGQPANSPDTNVLDLGFFKSIEALQQERRTHSIEELVEWTEEAFNNQSHEKLNKVFLTHQSVCEQIILHEGKNDYKIPHVGKDALARNGSLPTRIKLSDEAKAKIQQLRPLAPVVMEAGEMEEEEYGELQAV